MTSLPVHPALTHLPLGLALVAPLALLWGLWASRRGTDRQVWILPVALQVLVLAGGLLAYQTGSREEDQAERRVPKVALETHERRAQVFLGASTAAALLAVGALAARGRAARWSGGFAAGASLAALVLGLATGHAGGTLVYQHGAGTTAAAGGAVQPQATDQPRHED